MPNVSDIYVAQPIGDGEIRYSMYQSYQAAVALGSKS